MNSKNILIKVNQLYKIFGDGDKSALDLVKNGMGKDELLEKWSRDSKILDIFEGTQQIQQLIVARRLLGKASAELK